MPGFLNGYDLALCISQNTLNNQLMLLMADGIIESSLSIPNPTPYAPGLGLQAELNPPALRLVQEPNGPLQAVLSINLKAGTYCYPYLTDTGWEGRIVDVKGWVYSMVADVVMKPVHDMYNIELYGKASRMLGVNVLNPAYTSQRFDMQIPAYVQQQLSSYVGNADFLLQALLLDFSRLDGDDVSLTTGELKVEFKVSPPSEMSYQILDIVRHYTPYVLGYYATSRNPAHTAPHTPLLAPTNVQLMLSQYMGPAATPGHETGGLNALCYVAMTGNKAAPYPDGKVPPYTWNPIREAATQGQMLIDNHTFNQGYVAAVVLPVLSQAMHLSEAWQQSGNEWALSDRWDDGGPSGHGPALHKSTILDIYGRSIRARGCKLALNVGASVNNRLVYDGSGLFHQSLDLFADPLVGSLSEFARASSTLPFSFQLTLMAGADGTITAKMVTWKGELHQEHICSDYVSLVGGLLHDNMNESISQISGSFAAFEQADFSAFSAVTTSGFHSLSGQLILPASERFYYSNIGLSPENDIVLEIGYKS